MNPDNFWIIPAFATPLLFAVSSIVNKWLIDKHFPGAVSSLIFMLLSNLLFVPLGLFGNLFWFKAWHWSLILGVIYGGMFYFQLKVLKEKEASEVAILSRSKPIVLAILAHFLLRENLPVGAYVGIGLLTLGGMLISGKQWRFINKQTVKNYGYLFTFILLSSLVSIGQKYIITPQNTWQVTYWMNMGTILTGLLLLGLPLRRQQFLKYLKLIPGKVYVTKISSQIAYLAGTLAHSFALAYGSVSIVGGIYSIQPLMVILIASLLTLYFPGIIKEDVSSSSLGRKIAAVALVIGGSWLLL